jgi:hypothetical protein
LFGDEKGEADDIWSGYGDRTVFGAREFTSILQRCLEGEIPEADVTAWAELVEGRPSIDYESGKEEELADALFELSTPEINEPVTLEKCWRLLKAFR